MKTKTKARRKSNTHAPVEVAPPEPAWRRNAVPAKRKSKARRNQVALTPLNGKTRGARKLELPALPRPHLALRQWILVPFLAAVIFGIVQLNSSERFYVSAAEIYGNQRVPAEEIYAASQVDRQSIFWVRPADVDQRVKSLAGILSAHTHVRLPNQVVIEVEEQVPLVEWQTTNETQWIAKDGRTIPAVGMPPPMRLHDPDANGAAPLQGQTEQGDLQLRPKLMADLLALHAQRADLADVYYGAVEGLYFVAPEGWTVYLGTSGDMNVKLAQLQAMQREIAGEAKTPKVIDLRLDGAAFYR
jgi:cell division septal protein FtsQ